MCKMHPPLLASFYDKTTEDRVAAGCENAVSLIKTGNDEFYGRNSCIPFQVIDSEMFYEPFFMMMLQLQ